MNPSDVRKLFLDFFEERDHKFVPSIPVAAHGDPTLLFTNAGMNQFKDVFLGTGTRPYRRAVNTQKCIRVSGKHNDLEEVGRDGYHHTFFEMLGNWSFGDYFKKEAIKWGWEFVVEVCGIPPERLWATVFAGDKKHDIPPDEESERLWYEQTSIPNGHVLRFGKEDNFWEMGYTGPCGPCSEIHIDLGPSGCDNQSHPQDGSKCRVNGDCSRFIELWNLVFIQFNRKDEDTLVKLPQNHVDTGMGFERLVALMDVKEKLINNQPFVFTNYNTGLFAPIFEKLELVCGVKYSHQLRWDQLVACRVIADHIRALCIAIADGVMPDKKRRGSVLRSLLRRAARYGRQNLNIDRPFLYELVEPVAEVYADIFPEVSRRTNHIKLVIEAEEKSFSVTIGRGIKRFYSLIDKIRSTAPECREINGFEAYKLYHQDGFPKDLIELMAREEGFVINRQQWMEAEKQHKLVSMSSAMSFRFDLSEIENLQPTEFCGYWERENAQEAGTKAKARLLKVIGNEAVVLDKTPFYPEGGGQVGDSGIIYGKNFKFIVNDTGRIGEIIVHYGELQEASVDDLPDEVTTEVDFERRMNTAANHTATHLLHWALRQTLGSHATQQGSYVCPDYLRFDFTHARKLTDEEMEKIEDMVNARVIENSPVKISIMPIEEAKRSGAMALFGEKYGEEVRVVQIADFSRELCGGTHLESTGQIGFFKILSEEAVQSGVRRIVAVTRLSAAAQVRRREKILKAVSVKLSTPLDHLEEKLSAIVNQIKELQKKARETGRVDKERNHLVQELLKEAVELEGVKIIKSPSPVGIEPSALGEVVDFLRFNHGPVVGVVIGKNKDVYSAIVFSSKTLASEGKIDCGGIIKFVCEKFGRRGGGRADFARTGWKQHEKIKPEEFVEIAFDQIYNAVKKKA